MADLPYTLFQDGSTPSREMLDTLLHQLHWDDEGGGSLNRQGYRLRFEKAGEAQTPEGSVTRYRIFAEGAPEDKVYGFSFWEIGKLTSLTQQDVYVNAQGLLMTRQPRSEEEFDTRLPGSEVIVTPKNISGEPTRYALVSRDSGVSAYGTLVPNPVVTQVRGCRLEARLAVPDSSAVMIVADGFEPRTRLTLVLESLGEISNIEVATDNDGHAVVAGFPYIKGKSQGILKVSAEGNNCLPSVQLPWGSATAAAEAKK